MSRRLTVAAVLAASALSSCADGGSPTLTDLQRAINDGKDCAALIDVKNAMDPKSTDYENAPVLLRSVGCYDATSERTDQ